MTEPTAPTPIDMRDRVYIEWMLDRIEGTITSLRRALRPAGPAGDIANRERFRFELEDVQGRLGDCVSLWDEAVAAADNRTLSEAPA